jgi:hypothetical protein
MKKILALTTATFILVATTQAQQRRQDSLAKEAAKTELWEPVPAMVTPGKNYGDAPSDAVILYNGKDVSQWEKEKGGAPGWQIDKDGALTVVKGSGNLATKQGLAVASYT